MGTLLIQAHEQLVCARYKASSNKPATPTKVAMIFSMIWSRSCRMKNAAPTITMEMKLVAPLMIEALPNQKSVKIKQHDLSALADPHARSVPGPIFFTTAGRYFHSAAARSAIQSTCDPHP